jgi:drug/metabolite transporter (DMT)-like permease
VRSPDPAGGPTSAFVAIHLVGCAVTWGGSFLLMKLIDGQLSVGVIAAARALLAAAALGIAIVAIGQSLLPQGREWRDWAFLGTMNGWVPNMLVAYALLHMDSGPAALIQASGPLMTALLAHAFLAGERLTAARSAGIAIGAIGVVLLIGPKALAGGATTLAILAMLLVTLGYAIGNVYTRTIPAGAPLRLALGQQVVSAIASTVIVFALSDMPDARLLAAHGWTLLALGLVSTALPIWIFMRLLTRAGPTRAAMTGYLVPATAIVLGVVVLGEPIVPRQILGGIIVLFGVAVVTGLLRWPTRRTA